MRRLSILLVCSLPTLALSCFAPGGNESDSSSSDDDDDNDQGDDDDDDDDSAEETSQGNDSANGTSGGTASTSSNTSATGASASTTGTSASTSSSSDSITSTSGPSSAGDEGTMPEECTDLPPDDRYPCSTWLEWGECEAEWMLGFCETTCGKCEGGGTSASGGDDATTADSLGTTTPTSGDLGDDNPWGTVDGGMQGHSTRYWDCCKASCGWAGNANNPVSSCDQSDNSLGVTEQQSACFSGGAYTCHRMAPWAYSNVVSFGFAAVNGVGCGTCFQLQFTGGTHNAGADPGSQSLAGKQMIVMATNIGDISQGQFDILIPGGGVGQFNACSNQWGIDAAELGAQYGGFLLECKQQHGNDYAASRECTRQKCESVFGSRGLDEMYDGCMWFVDWFGAADNPSFTYQQVECPAELSAAAH